jgi:hypothetical protein
MPTNKMILNRGIKYLSWALPAVFIGPTVIHFAFINKQQPLFPLLLGVGILIGFIGILLIFKGIMTIISSLKD